MGHVTTRMRIARVLLALVLCVCGGLGRVHAQERGRTYVEGGAALTHQAGPSGNSPETYVTAPGGTTTGWFAGAGVSLGERVAVIADWTRTGRMTAIEPSRYFMTFHEHRRDQILTVGVHLVLASTRWFAIEPAAGLALTFADARSRREYVDPFFPRETEPPVTHELDTGIGPMFGVALRVGTARVAIVPSYRLLRTGIGGGHYDDLPGSPAVDIESIYPGGYPEWTMRLGVALRVGL
jgi:hypothetical protein